MVSKDVQIIGALANAGDNLEWLSTATAGEELSRWLPICQPWIT